VVSMLFVSEREQRGAGDETIRVRAGRQDVGASEEGEVEMRGAAVIWTLITAQLDREGGTTLIAVMTVIIVTAAAPAVMMTGSVTLWL
jgi:hypothetical protein